VASVAVQGAVGGLCHGFVLLLAKHALLLDHGWLVAGSVASDRGVVEVLCRLLPNRPRFSSTTVGWLVDEGVLAAWTFETSAVSRDWR